MNTIRDLKQQEKYTNILKRKNKEKNIYKSKNSTLRIEKMNLIKAVERKDKEIERLNKELQDTKEHLGEYLHEQEEENKRINNIIDKLEIDIEIGTGKYTYDTDYNRGLCDAFIYMSERLQELKENNK